MSYSVTVEGLKLTLRNFNKLDKWVQSDQVPTGPLVNISDIEGTTDTPYTVTVLAYLPDNKLNKVENTSGLSLQSDLIYLNYYGGVVVKTTNKGGEEVDLLCRDFRVEYNCKEKSPKFNLYYIQFEYQLLPGTPSVDAIIVRDDDEDPRTDRGTVTTPADAE